MSLVAYDPCYVHSIPANHRFPMEKYKLLFDKLQVEKILSDEEIIHPSLYNPKDLLAHDFSYVHRLVNLELDANEQRVTGFKHNEQLIQRELTIVDGTIRCAKSALTNGFTFNIAGGTHHAYSNRGEGFCLLNDQAEAALKLLSDRLVEKVLIVDLDVHQGNGTAQIFRNNNDVFTFSMHARSNYPLRKESSDLDIELNDGTDDDEYLLLLEQAFANVTAIFEPDFIFYQCGADVLDTDKLGRLGLTMNGCNKRDLIVFELADRMNIPITACSGGGYSPDIHRIVDVHLQTVKNGLALKKKSSFTS